MVTVGHVPHEINRLCFYFLQEEGPVVDTRPRRFPITSAGLEVKCMLKFSRLAGARFGGCDETTNSPKIQLRLHNTGAPADQLQESRTIPFDIFANFICCTNTICYKC